MKLGDMVIVAEIDDTGHGIPEEHLDKLFDPFFTTKDVGEGTGLGLPVCRKIAEIHKAILNIRNRDEGGVSAALIFKKPEGD
jgi:signal transduction histidine kinase